MIEILSYGFMVRALVAGLVIAIISPLIGIFLVLRRYSLIADTLSHISLAGIAIGLIANINPIITALGLSSVSSILIEKLRSSKKVYGESSLSIFLSGSLALAVILISVAKGFNVNLFNYLFGSILTVEQFDIYLILFLGLVIVFSFIVFNKELIFISFDEEGARVAGISVVFFNNLLIILSALTISVAIPVVGILLISALIVIPVVTALQLKKGFLKTVILAEMVSLFSVLFGIITSFYLNIPAGGAIVFISILIFLVFLFIKRR